MQWLTNKRYSKLLNILAVIFVGFVFLCWSFRITPDLTNILAGPDEGMRYGIPQFIYEHHRLPTGYETEVQGYWSYAFYPQFLGALISAGFMGIASFFNDNTETLVRAARLTSLLFGVIAAVFIRRSMRLLFRNNTHKDLIGNVAMIFFALLPQVSYLSAYINNDIIALAGVSIIVYACLHAHVYAPRLANAAYFAVGTVIAVLGYQNSYGFVLVGFLYLLWRLIAEYRRVHNSSFVARYLLVALGIPALLCVPFLVRNMLLYNGDIFGLRTFRSEYMRWVRETGIIIQTPYHQGIVSLLLHTHWIIDTIQSFIVGYFGGFSKGIAKVQYWPYYAFFVTGLVGFVVYLRRAGRSHQKYMLGGALLLGSLITIGLSLYYTLAIDYQPQGRYIIYLLIPVILAVSAGIVYIVEKTTKTRFVAQVLIGLAALYIGLHLGVVYQTLF